MLGILAGSNVSSVLIGDDSIQKRPMKRVTEPLKQMGAKFIGRENAQYTPIAVEGTKLHSFQYKMPVASAQVKSAILLAALQAEGETVVTEIETSRDHTEADLTLATGKTASWITSRQIESARIAMTRYMKRGGKVWIKIFPHKPYTKKPLEVRMGSGKGAPEGWVAVVKPGKVMFEIAGVSEEIAREALRLASHKLPVKCKVVKRQEIGGESNES